MSMSNYLATALQNATLRGLSYTPPVTVYVALFTSNPTPANTGAEVSTSGTAYVRQAVTFSVPSNGSTSNSADVVFPVATAGWGTVSYVGLYDASSGGNLLHFGALTTPQTVSTGNQFIIQATQLTDVLS